ncbi:MAG: Asp-tRNA(Asn)/Glu-tRNA(Gln) amidotransferase subunit GatA, partial [Hyphomicrobiaceae bacterium]|nr:Asp-tRNA(Asn)/Glu-tRNA(Gln) amidotransferase subunit GatA [Hyphomicrobiaceae bacterium]
DNFCTKGVLTTAGSRILKNFVPPYESVVTEQLFNSGIVCVGKTNLDEFAMGSSTETSYFGPTKNPIGEKLGLVNLTPGGSSGGSAAAVAANFVLGAIGTDTGGSIRQPASYCGIVGMKPTYGACSRWGIVAYASSLDQAGAFGNSVKDVAILLDSMIGYDSKDSTSIPNFTPCLEQAAETNLDQLRIGVISELVAGKATADICKIWDKIQDISSMLSAEIVEISMPYISYALPAYYVIALSEASSNLARYDGVRYGYRAKNFSDLTEMYAHTRAEGFGAEVKKRILMGTFSLSSGYYDQFYQKALKVRQLVSNNFRDAFDKCDVILSPTTPTGAFALGTHESDPVSMYQEDIFTVPINLAGLPALSLPGAKDSRGMPLGIQVIGPQKGDASVVRVAATIEQIISKM